MCSWLSPALPCSLDAARTGLAIRESKVTLEVRKHIFQMVKIQLLWKEPEHKPNSHQPPCMPLYTRTAHSLPRSYPCVGRPGNRRGHRASCRWGTPRLVCSNHRCTFRSWFQPCRSDSRRRPRRRAGRHGCPCSGRARPRSRCSGTSASGRCSCTARTQRDRSLCAFAMLFAWTHQDTRRSWFLLS